MISTVIAMPTAPLILELHTEGLMKAISALRGAGFRVLATPDRPGRYLVEDLYLDDAPARSGGAA